MIERLTFVHDLIMFEGEIWIGTATKSLISTFSSLCCFKLCPSLSLYLHFLFFYVCESESGDDYDDDGSRESALRSFLFFLSWELTEQGYPSCLSCSKCRLDSSLIWGVWDYRIIFF